MAQLAKTTFEGEVFSHRQLWVAARAMRDRAESEPKGSFYFDMTAMLLACLTVEAYCNFMIDALDPEIFKREREIFGSRTDAKVLWVAERAGVAIARGQRPFQTVISLNRLRDKIVHAKPEVYAGEVTHSADVERPFMSPGELQQSVSRDGRARALEDVEDLCEGLHAGVLSNATPAEQRRIEPFALKGTLQRQSSHTTTA
jgi:hypothetical protein